MKKTSSPRSIAALNLPIGVPALIAVGRQTVGSMENNPLFKQPIPPLAQVSTSLDALEAAQQATHTRAPGTVEARDAARAIVVFELHQLKGYVQSVADADRPNGAKIIASATMHVKRAPAGKKADFAAKPGRVSGSVHLVARSAGPRSSYEWQWSIDGGKTWQPAPVTVQAHTIITGLPVATICLFRFRAVTKAGEGEWSQTIAFVVR